jgi:hypothetical protein
MKNFNSAIFLLSSIIIGLLLIPSFITAAAHDEGTIGTSIIWLGFAKLFSFLRFPTHTIFWSVFSNGSGIFFLGLLLNCFFYGFITERLLYFKRKSTIGNN